MAMQSLLLEHVRRARGPFQSFPVPVEVVAYLVEQLKTADPHEDSGEARPTMVVHCSGGSLVVGLTRES